MKLRAPALCLLTLFIVTSTSVAKADWSGGIEGGTILRDDVSATKLRFSLYNNDRPLTHHVYVDWIRSSDKNDSYKAAYLPRYWFSDALYAFAEIHHRIDKPFGVDQQTQGMLGAGYKFLSTETTTVWAELGAGVRTTDFEDNRIDRDESFVLGRASYRQALLQLFKFEFDVEAIQSDKLSENLTEAGISMRLGGGSIKYGYRRRQQQEKDQPTVTNDDTFLSFVYGF